MCERTWHDRLEVVAEGEAAKLWNPDGALHEIELAFAPADATAARDASARGVPRLPINVPPGGNPAPLPLAVGTVALPAKPAPTRLIRRWPKSSGARSFGHDTMAARRPFKGRLSFSLPGWRGAKIQAIDQGRVAVPCRTVAG